MEYQIDFHYKNGAEDFAHIFGEDWLNAEITSTDWSVIESITVKPWKD